MGVETSKSSVQLGSELVNVSLRRGSHRAGDCARRSITGREMRKGTGTRSCPSGRLVSTWRLDPALADCHRSMSTAKTFILDNDILYKKQFKKSNTFVEAHLEFV